MTKAKNIKIAALITNIIAIAVMCTILIGSTFAWFTDSAGSIGNKIQAGTLKVDLQLLDREVEDNWHSLKNDNQPIFDYENWEPGYTDIKILKVVNEGTLALKWKAKIVANGTLSALADVIDVYVLPSEGELAYPTDRTLDGYTYAGTVADFVEGIETTTTGTLLAGGEAYLGIALKMRSDASNEYQGLDLLGSFDIVIVATQLSSEGDGFGDDYDSETTLDFAPVANSNQLKIALANKETNIVLTNDIVVEETYAVNYNVNIDGNGNALYRQSAVAYSRNASEPFIGNVFDVTGGATLTMTNVVLDGGAVWTGEIDSVLGRGTVNAGLTVTGSLVSASGTSTKIVIGEGVTLQNNDGALAVVISSGATLTLDGGEIMNNNSNAGAVWGGGHITINSGKINSNSSTGIAGAIRMASNCNLTMYGGQINNNKATTNGGAIYNYNNTVYTLEGGEISGNYAVLGGAIHMDGAATIKIKNDFRMVGNVANDAGGIRFYKGSTIKMEGGYIADNVSINKPNWNGFYCWNTSVNILDGEIKDAITIDGSGTPTLGGDKIFGVVYINSAKTCNLAENFGVIKFNVAVGSNFTAFNFKPALGYTYTEGDEEKLVCTNEGYVTYYDTSTETFRIKTTE